MNEETVSAIPGAEPPHATPTEDHRHAAQRVSISSILLHPLPSGEDILSLIEEYFRSVHWFSLVILESKFRNALSAVQDGMAEPSEKLFLLLLSTILSLGAWYRSHQQYGQNQARRAFWRESSQKLIANAEREIMHLLDQSSVLAIQTLTLLGSFYVYQGRPSLSFSLLGATVKAAQAARLHQEMSRRSQVDAEEQRRLWWTIYTWDRQAHLITHCRT